ncbi:MAG: hypothetical protein KAT75_06530 [Dehalococcoidia bacterium]|nr:hypothetical protein [Dehalococcoidia bacterium]
MEIDGKEYCHKVAQSSDNQLGRKLFQILATEERGHYLTLLDYREYLSDPAGWFVTQEHPSLDGG